MRMRSKKTVTSWLFLTVLKHSKKLWKKIGRVLFLIKSKAKRSHLNLNLLKECRAYRGREWRSRLRRK